MTGALLLGAFAGLGLITIAAGLAPRRISLAEALEAVIREPRPPLVTAEEGGWAARLGRPAVTLLAALGLPTRGLRRDLALLGRPPERQLAEQATAAITGLLLAPALAGLLAAAGIIVPWQLPAAGAIALGAAGFTVPALAARQEAAARRREARHALAAFLDLVVISIAAGAGVEAALTYAGATGRGWAFTQIRGALEVARLTRRPPWEALGQLGERTRHQRADRAGRLHHPGRDRRRQGPGQPHRQGRRHPRPPAVRRRDHRAGRHRADEPAPGAAVRRVPPADRLPGCRPRPHRHLDQH